MPLDNLPIKGSGKGEKRPSAMAIVAEKQAKIHATNFFKRDPLRMRYEPKIHGFNYIGIWASLGQ
tara:strand:- start:1409 stop:1603 length:195 start_codon:yes stop_codon:yes gene_type:complete